MSNKTKLKDLDSDFLSNDFKKNLRRVLNSENNLASAIHKILDQEVLKLKEEKSLLGIEEASFLENLIYQEFDNLPLSTISKSLSLFTKLEKSYIYQTPEKLLKITEDSLDSKLNTAEPRDIVSLINSYQAIRRKPKNTTLKLINSYFIKNSTKFDEISLSMIINSFSKFKVKPTSAFTRAWETRFNQIYDLFGDLALTVSIRAFADLGVILQDSTLEKWSSAFQTLINNKTYFKPKYLASSLYSFSLMGKYPSNENVFLSELIRLKEIFDPIQKSTFRMTKFYFDMHHPKSSLPTQLDEYKNAPPVQTKRGKNKIHKKAERILKSRGIDFIPEFIIPETGIPVDMFEPPKDPSRSNGTIWQSDGPPHYIYNLESGEESLLPKDKLLDLYLESTGYRIERLDYRYIESVKENNN